MFISMRHYKTNIHIFKANKINVNIVNINDACV